MAGHRVQTIDDVASIADVFITCTGNRNVITRQHMNRMKNGAVVANMGHRYVQELNLWYFIRALIIDFFSNTEIEVSALKTQDLMWEKIRSQVAVFSKSEN